MAGNYNNTSNQGWISVYRSILESSLWLSEPFTRGQAWFDLLLLANHTEGFIRVRGNKVPLTRGQVGWSVLSLSKRWKWSRSKVKRYLNELEKEAMIKQQTNSITSIITISNYNFYQNTIQQTNSKQTTDEQQSDTNNKDKKKNNVNKRRVTFSPPSLEEVISHFLQLKSTEYEAQKFFSYYTSNGWKVGKNSMVDWTSACKNWLVRANNYSTANSKNTNNKKRHDSDF